MHQFFLLIGLILFASTAHAQGENNVWHFGLNAAVDFNSGTPVAVSGSQISTTEGSASICDASGMLLFYTDGVTIWNRNNQPMPGANQNLLGNASSTQSAVIVPRPGSSTQYYVFTADQGGYSSPNVGIHYSIVDMTLNNGFGDVTVINVLLQGPPTTEKISACRHANCTDYWIVTHTYLNNQFQAFQLTSSGILPPVLSNVGTPHLNTTLFFESTIGYMKISPNRKRIGLVVYGAQSFAEVFDFDDATGTITNPVTITYPQSNGTDAAYGLSFSPNSNVLYVSYYAININSVIYQYNLLAGSPAAIVASEFIAGDNMLSLSLYFSALQIGPDNKIYVASFLNQLDVINNPDVLGAGCNFQLNAVQLGSGFSQGGLPNRIDDSGVPNPVSLGPDTTFCGGAVNLLLSTSASSGSTYQWSNGSTASTIQVNSPGLYAVTVTDTACQLTSSDTIAVELLSDELYPRELVSCTPQLLIQPLSPGAASSLYVWSTGDTTQSLSVNAAGQYAVTVTNGSCVFSDTVQVDFSNAGVVAPVNVFTPNGDGINDVLDFSTAAAEGFDLEVYSRWGTPLFRSANPAQGWDGTFNGSPAEEGVYYWRLRTTDCFGNPEDVTGFVSLMR
jgi:gliding motility-associated-like protein